jgi:hypothetical protein
MSSRRLPLVVFLASMAVLARPVVSTATQVFVVDGIVSRPDGSRASGLKVDVQNRTAAARLGKPMAQSVQTDGNGAYSVTFLDLFADVALVGDDLLISVYDGALLVGQTSHTVTAQEEFSATVNVALAGIVVRVGAASLRGDGSATTTVEATVTDKTGSPVANDTLTASASAGAIGAFSHKGGGVYGATFVAPATSTSMEATVTVTSSALNASGAARVAIVGVPSNVAVIIVPPELPADGKATATVTVTIARDGVAVSDEVVVLEAPAEFGSVGPVTNKKDGTYTATFTAGTKAGMSRITARATKSGDAGSSPIGLTAGAPRTLGNVTVVPAEVLADGVSTALITVVALDEFGNGAPGLTGFSAEVVAGGGAVGAATDAGEGRYLFRYTSPAAVTVATATTRIALGDLAVEASVGLTAQAPATALLLSVDGVVYRADRKTPAPDGLGVRVENVGRNLSAAAKTGDAGPGRYSVLFSDFLGGATVAATGDVLRVTVVGASGAELGRQETVLRSVDVQANTTRLDVVTNVGPARFEVSGVLVYDDGATPVQRGDGVVARATLRGATATAPVGEPAAGRFSVVFSDPAGAVSAGDSISVALEQDGATIVARTVEAGLEHVSGGVLDMGVVPSGLRPASPIFVVVGRATAPGGAGLEGFSVRIRNVAASLTASGAVGESGPGQYQATFFALGEVAVRSGDVLRIELLDAGGKTVGVRQVTVSPAQVVAAQMEADISVDAQVEVRSSSVTPVAVRGGSVLRLSVVAEPFAKAVADVSALGTGLPAALVLEESPAEPGTYGASVAIADDPAVGGVVARVRVTITDLTGNTATVEHSVRLIAAWDMDGDGAVDIRDLVSVALVFGEQGAGRLEDVNRDGAVDIVDLVIVASHFGEGGVSAAPARLDSRYAPIVSGWMREARLHDDGSARFRRGIAVLGRLLSAVRPARTAVFPNYPNPFNPETWIPFELAETAEVRITIFSPDGDAVRALHLGRVEAGAYLSRERAAYWDGTNERGEPVASGVYVYQVEAGTFRQVRRMVVVR